MTFHPLFAPGTGRHTDPSGQSLQHNRHPPDWRYAQRGDRTAFEEAAGGNSYVINPFVVSARSKISDLYVPRDGDGLLATAEIWRRVPTFPRHTNQTSMYWSYGCAAMIRSMDRLPVMDVLPVPMQWQWPAAVGYACPSTMLAPDSGRARNVPSETPLYPVFSDDRPDLPYLQPLAADPRAAIKLLTPQVVELTTHAEAAWWCEDRFLFVWVHKDLPRMTRPVLADFARQIHAALVAAK